MNLSVCFSVPYARPWFWVDLDQIWHVASLYPLHVQARGVTKHHRWEGAPLVFNIYKLFDSYQELPSRSVDNIWAMMSVWRITGKIITTVLCCTVYDSCAQWYTHTHDQILQLIVGLGLHAGRYCGQTATICWATSTSPWLEAGVQKLTLHCWLDIMVLSAARCKRFAYSAADAATTPSSLASLKSRKILPFGRPGKEAIKRVLVMDYQD